MNNKYSILFGILVSFVNFWSALNINYVGDHILNIPTKLVSIGRGGFREEDWNVKVYRRRLTQCDGYTSHDPLDQVN